MKLISWPTPTKSLKSKPRIDPCIGDRFIKDAVTHVR